MRKSTFLLSLLLGLGGTAEMSAQAFIPQASVDGGTTYEYYVKCAGGNSRYWASSNVGENNAMLFVTNDGTPKLTVKLVNDTEEDGTLNGRYKIYGTNLGADNNNTLIGCTGTTGGSTVTWYATDGNGAENASWTVETGNSTGTMNGYKPYYSICPGTSAQSWNPYADATTNKLYDKTNNNSNWNFIPANLDALKKAAADIQTALANQTFAGGFGFDATKKAAVDAVIAKVTAEGYTTYAEADATQLISTYSEASTAVATLQSGYYKIVSKATNRYPYMFNDDFYASNSEKFTLTAQNEVNTNNGIWKVTMDGNTMTIVNGQGQGIKTKGGSGGNSITTSTLHIDNTDTQADGYYAFTERLNCADNTYNTGDYRALTVWLGQDSKVEYNDNRWKFEEVEVAEGNLYTVVTPEEGAYVTYTRDGVTQHAYGGGFFVFESAPDAADFTASNLAGYESTVSIVGNTISFIRSAEGYYSDIQALLPTAIEARDMRGVGYPTVESNAYTTFNATIEAAQAITAETGSAEALAALQSAITAYKSTTDLAQLQTLEDGKAYTISARLFDGRTRMMYFDTENDKYIMTDAGSEATDAQKEAAILICRDLGNNQYAFVNNAGKFFIWRGGGNASNGFNSNKGYQANYADNSNAANVTLEKIVKSNSQEALFGCLTLRCQRNSTQNNGRAYFVVQPTNNNNTGNDGYDGASDTFFTSSYSSALIFEEAEYPNSVSLRSTEGSVEGAKYIATFSAPFATVIPENVEAYYVGSITNEEETKAQMTKIETEAIPANQGVILVSNDDATAAAPVTMLPATTETAAEIAGANQLRNSAGAAKVLDDGFILTNRNGEVAFYPVIPNTTLGMNKSYLGGSSMGAAAFTLSFGGTATGIDTVTGNADNANAPIYDLSGRRVQKAVKGGLYIQNGRKFIVK